MRQKTKFLIIAVLLSSCGHLDPTPYQASDQGGFGYVDRPIATGQYEIQVRGNTATSAYTLERYFNHRATELCGGDNYESFIKHEKETEIHDGRLTGYYFTPTTTSAIPMVTGTVTCKSALPQAGIVPIVPPVAQ